MTRQNPSFGQPVQPYLSGPQHFMHRKDWMNISLLTRKRSISAGGYNWPGVRYTPALPSVVYHVGGGTLQRGNSKKTFLNFRNNLIMLAKNWPLSKKLWALPVRISLDAMAAWRGLLTGDAGYFWAIVKAHFAFVNWLLFHQQKSRVSCFPKRPITGCFAKEPDLAVFHQQEKNLCQNCQQNIINYLD